MSIEVTKVWIENDKMFALQIPEAEIYKREWVGLTDEERKDCVSEYYRWGIADAVEAKLKDKNAN